MKLGIIGFGHLASAFTEGVLKSDYLNSEQIMITSLTDKTKEDALQKFGIASYSTNSELATNSDYIIISVKPHLYADIINEIKDSIKPNTIILSFMAGTKLSQLEELLPENSKLARVMPNIAMAVRESLTTICPNSALTEPEISEISHLFNAVGKVITTTEENLEKISAVSSSGLGFVGYLLNAFEMASLDLGLPEKYKELISTQTFLGAVKTVQETDISSKQLSDKVATKGGSTIEGLYVLMDHKVDENIVKAVNASFNKLSQLSKK
ncbi:pyrroline-5-carboxylate reductase [Microaceticoccus formicicus]|uniref:pyrroline-5-carboxylate reductase n=1 Tax=Microaceticoccus formicicus TaxID=3118105 RepID=UPI003CCFF909|nr:pyrroline-5-carboxylate reductase [Peptoniphilaceae bacterium AMB_02]